MEQLIYTEQSQGFEIRFYACEEHINIEDMFSEPEDIQETYEKLNSGEWVLFCAKVTASKNGIELADEYLGGCIYSDEMDFVTQNDYYEDMKNTVIENAKQAIIDLSK